MTKHIYRNIKPAEQQERTFTHTVTGILIPEKQIAVDGALKQDRWQKDGQNFSKVYIVANTVQLLGGKSDGEQTHTSSAPKSAHNTNQSDDGGFPEDNSDIPF